jgi:hypothetical protein
MERDEVVSAEDTLSYAMDDWTDRMDTVPSASAKG